MLAAVSIVVMPVASAGEDLATPLNLHAAERCERHPSAGFRLIYAHPVDASSRFQLLSGALVNAARRASSFVAASTPASPKRVRLVCGITEVALRAPANAADAFLSIRDQLLVRGYDDRDRKYVVWWDGPSPYACGEGSLVDDDRRDPRVNLNNEGPGFALVYRPSGSTFCDWTAVLHEMLHTLGAVQASAPHGTATGHCTDGDDVMCRRDVAGPEIDPVCASALFLDCRSDDYFSEAPAPGSYLATHWNVARSSWLADLG